MDEPALWAALALFVLFSVLAAIAAAAQSTLHHMSRVRVRQLVDEDVPRAQAEARAVEETAFMLSANLVLYATATAGAAAAGLLLTLNQGIAMPWLGVGVALVLLAVLLLLQLVARALALHRPERASALLMAPLRALSILLWPLVAPATALERGVLRLLGITEATGASASEQELRMLVEAVEESGGLQEEEREMIHGIFNLSQRPVREIMVPRIDMVAVEHEASVQEVIDRVTATGHSRIPVYQESVDHVVGVLYAKDLLKYLRTGGQDNPAGPLARPAYFVPETKKIHELLHELQRQKVHMAIVVDEYGGTAGLITIEDMLEEIVGEIQDEYDVEEALFERVSEREAIFDARMNLRDVGEVLNVDLEGELEEHEYDTLGGLVYERLGKVPSQGDEVKVNGYLISVLSTQGHRIKKVRVTLGAESAAAVDRADD